MEEVLSMVITFVVSFVIGYGFGFLQIRYSNRKREN